MEANAKASITDDQLLRIDDVTAITTLSKSCINLWVTQGKFIKPISLSPTVKVWQMGALRAWMANAFQTVEPTMNDSLVVYLDRNNTNHIVDPGCVPHSDDLSPLQNLVIDIINAGYEGVIVDEKRLKNGRYFCALSTNGNTPEGRLLIQLSSDYANGKPMPSSHDVLAQIKKAYDLKRTSKGGC